MTKIQHSSQQVEVIVLSSLQELQGGVLRAVKSTRNMLNDRVARCHLGSEERNKVFVSAAHDEEVASQLHTRNTVVTCTLLVTTRICLTT